MSARHVSNDHDLLFMVYWLLLNLHQVSEIRLISPLVYNLGLLHLVHTLIMEGTHSPVLCHITLTFFCPSSGMIYWWLSYTTWVNRIWSTHWSWKYMWASQCYICTWPWPHFQSAAFVNFIMSFFCDSVSFSVAMQLWFTIFCPHSDQGGYMYMFFIHIYFLYASFACRGFSCRVASIFDWRPWMLFQSYLLFLHGKIFKHIPMVCGFNRQLDIDFQKHMPQE